MTGTWVDGWESRLAELDIRGGGHTKPEEGVCVMEAVAWLRSQKHTDKPICVSPVIGQFMRSWNDGLPSNAERNRLLKPLIPIIVDTAPASKETELARSYMALDWLVRVHCPAFLSLTDSLKAHAVALSGLAPITDKKSLDAAMPLLSAARNGAAAAGDAARAAARAAAGAAAGGAAWAAAGDAAWAAAGAAAWATAGAAAWATAGAAAGDKLAPTVATLQESASDLVRRMAAVSPPRETKHNDLRESSDL